MSQDIFNLWNNTYNLIGSNLVIKGYSRAGERSSFQIPAISLMFDAGVRTSNTPNNIFISHCHADHIFDLPIILAGMSNKKTDIYSPVEENVIDNFIRSSFRLINNGNMNLPSYQINRIVPFKKINFSENKRNYQIEVFKCFHTVPTNGYGLSEIKKKLKPEYIGKKGIELVELKKSNVEICYSVEDYIFAYLTDTTIKVFNNKNIFKYKTIMVECTILTEDAKDSARKHKHTYWGDLLPIIKSHPDNHFLIIHISPRYNQEEIIDFFKTEKTKNNLNNVEPWINS